MWKMTILSCMLLTIKNNNITIIMLSRSPQHKKQKTNIYPCKLETNSWIRIGNVKIPTCREPSFHLSSHIRSVFLSKVPSISLFHHFLTTAMDLNNQSIYLKVPRENMTKIYKLYQHRCSSSEISVNNRMVFQWAVKM